MQMVYPLCAHKHLGKRSLVSSSCLMEIGSKALCTVHLPLPYFCLFNL